MRAQGVRESLAAAALLAAAWGLAGPSAAADGALGSAAASSGRYFGAALDPAYFDEKPYRDLAAESSPASRRRTR